MDHYQGMFTDLKLYNWMYSFRKTQPCNFKTTRAPSLLLQVAVLSPTFEGDGPHEYTGVVLRFAFIIALQFPGKKGSQLLINKAPLCALPDITSVMGILRKRGLLSSFQTDKYCCCGWLPWLLPIIREMRKASRKES